MKFVTRFATLTALLAFTAACSSAPKQDMTQSDETRTSTTQDVAQEGSMDGAETVSMPADESTAAMTNESDPPAKAKPAKKSKNKKKKNRSHKA